MSMTSWRPAPRNAPSSGRFTLYVSNQSFDLDPVDIRVYLDDELAVERDDQRYGLLNFWYYQTGSPEPYGPELSFELLDEPPVFQ